MRTYSKYLTCFMFFQIAICGDTIKFNTPDSIYILNKIDSILQSDQSLSAEYYLKSYDNQFKNIVYKKRNIEKEIDTVLMIPKNNISQKYLNHVAEKVLNVIIDKNFFYTIKNKKSLIMNKYYFLSSEPIIDIGTYSIDKIGMTVDLDPEFNSHFSGLFGASNNSNDKWELNGELDVKLENLWSTMERFGFYWKKLDSNNQTFNMQLQHPHLFYIGLGLGLFYKYELVNGFYTESSSDIDFEVSNAYYGAFYIGYRSGRINITDLGNINKYQRSSYKSIFITFRHNSLNRRLLPDRGLRLNIESNIGEDIYNDHLYFKNKLRLRYIFPLIGNMNLCLNSMSEQIKGLGGDIGLSRKIKYGGINSLRGYMDKQFSSDAISIQSIELHFQKDQFFRTLLFFDLGFSKNKTPKSSLGIGLYKLTGKALVELQYAIPEKSSFMNGKVHVKWTSRL